MPASSTLQFFLGIIFIVKQQTKTHLQKAYKRAAIKVMQVKYQWMSENGNQ
jgi:hypothetical protein